MITKRSLNDRLLPLALLDRLDACEAPAFVEAARLLAPLLASEISHAEVAHLRGQLGTTAPAIRGPLIELLIELCPSDEPLALELDDTLLEDYVDTLAHDRPSRDGAVAATLSRLAQVLGWPRVSRAVFRSFQREDAVAVLVGVDPLGWTEPDLAGLGEHRAAVVHGARLQQRTKLWRYLLAVLTPEWRRSPGTSALLTGFRSWDSVHGWLDDALYGLPSYVTRGVLTATEAAVLARLHDELHSLDMTQPDHASLDALGARFLRELCGDRSPLAVAHDVPVRATRDRATLS